VHATHGIELLQNTIGSTTASPLHTVITGGVNIDGYQAYGIYSNAGLYTHITENTITNGGVSATAAILIGAGAHNAQVNGKQRAIRHARKRDRVPGRGIRSNA